MQFRKSSMCIGSDSFTVSYNKLVYMFNLQEIFFKLAFKSSFCVSVFSVGACACVCLNIGCPSLMSPYIMYSK